MVIMNIRCIRELSVPKVFRYLPHGRRKNKRKNFIQESCPDRRSNPGPLHEEHERYFETTAVDDEIFQMSKIRKRVFLQTVNKNRGLMSALCRMT